MSRYLSYKSTSSLFDRKIENQHLCYQANSACHYLGCLRSLQLVGIIVVFILIAPSFQKLIFIFHLFLQNCVARALYDNIAESPDELAFQKGDILTVLEQNTSGLEGWWLCALKGRQGIVPGNRLRLLAGIYETGSDFNTLQRQGKRRSWHVQPNKVCVLLCSLIAIFYIQFCEDSI